MEFRPMAEQKPVDVSTKYPSTEDLARLPREEQQRRLGGQTSDRPLGVAGGQGAPAQRTKPPQGDDMQKSEGRRQQAVPAPQQRTLTEEEKQRRMEAFQKAASQQGPTPPFEQQMAQDDPAWTPQHVGQGVRQPDGGPHEGFERRMQRVLNAPHPHTIDYDRDGHGDSGGGRSARDIQNFHSRADRAAQVRSAVPQQADRNRDGYPDSSPPGVDGFRQDQIGYRMRLAARREAYNRMIEEGVPGFEDQTPLDVVAAPLPGDHTPNQLGTPGQAVSIGDMTPLAQAMIAPANPRTSPNAKAVQVSNEGPPRMDAQGQPVQASLGDQGQALVVSDPQGHTPPTGTANNPIAGDIQVSLPQGQPNPIAPAPQGGPAQPPVAHGATPAPAAAKASPAATSPPVAPAQQAVSGQQHAPSQQAPAQQPQSRVAKDTPAPPPANAPRPADAPGRGANQGK
jgi:hypothetical protein